jgi:hypothetical protein
MFSRFLSSRIMQFFADNRFRREMIVIISIKLFALFLIWECFFSHPLEENLKSADVAHHFISEKK